MKVQHLAGVVIGLLIIMAPSRDRQLLGAPGLAVSSVSGSLVHGATVAISGAGFGTKPTAAPLKYDDFQNLSIGQLLSANGWSMNGGQVMPDGSNGADQRPAASSALLRSGTPFTRNAHSVWWRSNTSLAGINAGASNFALTGLAFTKAYIDGWMSFAVNADPQPQNIKPIRLHSNSNYSANPAFFGPTVNNSIGCQRDGVAHSDDDWTDGYTGSGYHSGNWYGAWRHIQWMIDAGSGNNAPNGSCIMYVDGGRVYNHVNVPTIGNGTTWSGIFVGNYVRDDDHGDTHAYWESVYVDTSWARVEISASATYNAVSHREIQIPSAWSNSSITVRLNRGSFSSLQGLYLFVVDELGNVSPGHLLGGSSPPASPTNLRIVR